MKRIVGIALLLLIVASVFCGIVVAANSLGPALEGPAPNSGDGVSDGSGFSDPDNAGMGPAPNSGDGVPDGSGW